MKALLVNQLLKFDSAGSTERILWIDPAGRGLYVIEVQGSVLPVFREATELDALLRGGEVKTLSEDPWLARLNEFTTTENHKNSRDQAWLIIKPLVLEQPAIFEAKKRGKMIQCLMAEQGTTKQTIYRMLRRYWQRGMLPNALLPDYANCGAAGKERVITAEHRRPSSNGESPKPVIDADIRSKIQATITNQFATNQHLSLNAAYEEFITAHFADFVLDEHTGRQVLVPHESIPTLRQFRYWCEKDNNKFELLRIRRTPRAYDRDSRALLSSSTLENIGPGSRYQIDATIADIYLASRLNRKKIVGRPVLYVVVDVFTRMITGIYVGFEGPSWVGAMMALANAASDKILYCNQFDIEIEAHDWPCCSVPDILLGDRGEMAGSMVETLANNLCIHVENTAPFRPDWKGVVEQRFRLIPAKFKAYVPGYVAGDYKARGGRDYRLDALLDIHQFTRIIINCVLYYNNIHCLSDYDKLPEMVADDVPAIPADLWAWGIAKRNGTLRTFPTDTVKLNLLPTDMATVTAYGIQYSQCMHYSCRRAVEEHWFEKARQRGSWKVRISYEPRCMDQIYVHVDRQTPFLICDLTDRSRQYQGKTLWEIDQIRQDDRRQNNQNAREALQGRLNLTKDIKDIIAQAEVLRDEEPLNQDSNRQKVQGIRENRRHERREIQKIEAFRFDEKHKMQHEEGKITSSESGSSINEDYSLPSAEAIRKLKKMKPNDDGGEQNA